MPENNEHSGWQNITDDGIKPQLNDLEAFRKIIDACPYPVSVFNSEGTIIYSNEAGFRMYQINREVVGKWNLFKDPTINAVMPFEKIKRVFKGEAVFFPEVKVPLKELSSRNENEYKMEALYNDITYFPVMENGTLLYIVQQHVPSRVYQGRKEIEKAKEYMDNNWLPKFDLNKVVTASCLSSAHFTRLFRQNTGITAHEYYTRIKINKLKEKLGDPGLTVTEAFNACNLEYSGYFARVFKKFVGLTPMEYKRQWNKP